MSLAVGRGWEGTLLRIAEQDSGLRGVLRALANGEPSMLRAALVEEPRSHLRLVEEEDEVEPPPPSFRKLSEDDA